MFKIKNFGILCLGVLFFLLLAIGGCKNSGSANSSDKSSVNPPEKVTLSTTVTPNNSCFVIPAQGTYKKGAKISLAAHHSAGFQFDHWVNTDNNAINPTTVTMDADKVVELHCTPVTIPQVTLTTKVIPDGSCAVTPSGGSYGIGTVLTLTAQPNPGFKFVNWDNTNNNLVNPTTVTMDADKMVELHCAPVITKNNLTTVVSPADSCVVTPVSGTYDQGNVVTLTIQPQPGYQFNYSRLTNNYYSNPTTVTMDSDKEVQIYCAPEINYQLYGLNFSPFTTSSWPTNISEEDLRQKMEIVKNFTHWFRTFSATIGLEKVGPLSHQMGKKAAAGAAISNDLTRNETEIANLIAMGLNGEIDMAVVGNEYILWNNNQTAVDQLIAYIRRVREALPPEIPVTYADTYNILLQHPDIVDECDLVLANIYPYWEGMDIKYAVFKTREIYYELSIEFGKDVIISEAGWPSGGNTIGKAVPSPENAAYFFKNFVSWARSEGVEFFYFEAFDEPWKIVQEGEVGGHWGIWTSAGVLKPGMQAVFDGEVMADNWSGTEIVNGSGTPEIFFTIVPPLGSTDILLEGQIEHVAPADYNVAVFILVNGRWYIKPYLNNPLTLIYPDGWWNCNIATGGTDRDATDITAFLIPSTYNPPLVFNAASLPQELFDNAVDYVTVTR